MDPVEDSRLSLVLTSAHWVNVLFSSALFLKKMNILSCFGSKARPSGVSDVKGSAALAEPRCDWKLQAQFCVIGCVALLGWNFILGELGTLIDAFGESYGTWVSLCYSLCINAGQLLLVYMGNRFKFGPRFYIGCLGMGISQMLIAICAITFARDNRAAGFACGCIFVGTFGFANALMESSMFGLAALVTSECTEWIMIGEGIAGVLAWPVDMLCQAILEGCGVTDYQYPRMVLFYGLALLANLAVIPMYKYATETHPYMLRVFEIEADRQKFELNKSMKRPINRVVWDTVPMAFNVWANFTITFTVFPWLIFQMAPSSLATTTFGQLMTYCYQVFDTLGRFAPNLRIRLSKRVTRYACLARAIFIPLFFLCVHLTFSPFNQDWFRFIIMALFAGSNGIVATWCMIHGPSQVDQSEKEEMEVAGYVMAFALIFGILIGSVIATIIQQTAYM
ncbi:solute carrier 29 (nucleoside transporters), member [Perkinsus olseni]|uniref:Solute carrier 29 (Nucleoside transporters), member n=1 Tax=Perkinsus olseni TaxID=32597 RepID=A0A7J6L8A4_PEROL|nr:solute carrier 29 (nucleoside transporters), member [Perkinsus olseni]KAF4658711.1 solute carrier 29 (nucleoside transporters), member [Perkinsus olseni]